MMKTVFVVLPFGIENWLEAASKVAHEVEVRLGTYVHLITDFPTPVAPADMSPFDFLFNCLGSMSRAGIIAFSRGWRKSKECSLLHAIALAYELNILDMDKQPQDDGVVQACPFCKSEELSMCKLSRGKGYTMHCNDCGANGSVEDTEQEAIDAWNNCAMKGAEHVG